VILTVKDEEGRVIRRLNGNSGKGIHRIAWDLRYPDLSPTRLDSEALEPWSDPPAGPLAVPGTFSVELAKLVDGRLKPLAESQTFLVEPMAGLAMAAEDREKLASFQREIGELQRIVLASGEAVGEALRRIDFIRKALLDTPEADAAILLKAGELRGKLENFRAALFGDWTRLGRSEPAPPSVLQRLDAQLGATVALTGTHQKGFEKSAEIFSRMLPEMRRVIEVELPALEEEMESAGAPWTPGRRLPRWKKK
jgi:hypothetical protein